VADLVSEIDLHAHGVLEAHAGTGKTYTIVGLVVRLLSERKLSVRDILLVTYTQKAAGELQEGSFAWGPVAPEPVSGLTVAGRGRLRWEPATAEPSLVMWLVGDKPAGKPYFATVPALIKVISGGLVALRDADPQAFTSLLTQFFTVNTSLADTLGSLGLSPQVLTGMLTVAPAEGIENLLTTLIGSFGLDTVDKFMAAFDWSLVFEALGL